MLTNSKQVSVFFFFLMHCQRSPPSVFSLYTLMQESAHSLDNSCFCHETTVDQNIADQVILSSLLVSDKFHMKKKLSTPRFVIKPFRWNIKGYFLLAIS